MKLPIADFERDVDEGISGFKEPLNDIENALVLTEKDAESVRKELKSAEGAITGENRIRAVLSSRPFNADHEGIVGVCLLPRICVFLYRRACV